MAKTYATWDPAAKASTITLSNGNLTATNSTGGSSWKNCRATVGISSGKWYWEITTTVGGSPANGTMAGVVNTSESFDTPGYLGSGANGWAYYNFTGQFYHNGPNAYGATWWSTSTIGVALDMDAKTIEFFKANASQGVASTFGLAGTVYPAAAIFIDGQTQTANFGATAFTYTPPAGFNAGVYTGSDDVSRPSGGYPASDGAMFRTKDDIRRAREAFGVIPRRIIEDVAQRQAERIETDQQKILDELHRELQISGLEWDARYLAALNELRERLIEEEIGRRLKLKLTNERTTALLLIAAAV